jgi:hypothetical protein
MLNTTGTKNKVATVAPEEGASKTAEERTRTKEQSNGVPETLGR